MNNDRPQDVGRSHKRKPPRRFGGLLQTYQIVMRKELFDLLHELRDQREQLTSTERERRWKLAIMLAKELGADVEPPRRLDAPKVVSVPPAAVDFG